MKQVTAYVHTHWDREWYREFDEFRLRLLEVFDEVLDALQAKELPCFYFDGQTAALEDYLELRPEKSELIKRLVREKKLFIGPFYCSSDSFLVSGISLCRNLETGIAKSKEFGQCEFIGYIADSFGHSRCIPSILKYYGIDKACLWRGLGEYKADLDWEGIKVTNLIQGYFQDFLNTSLPAEKKAELLKKYLDKISAKSSQNVLLPIGADHLAIAANLMQQIKELNKIYSDYNITISSPFEYFNKIKSRTTVKGEFLENTLNFILPGVYSSRIYIKQANALLQWKLQRITEPLNALAYVFFKTKNRQNEINYANKLLIQNQAHDSIYGCCTDKTADEIISRYEKANTAADGITKRILRDLTDETAPLAVINLSNFKYSGKVAIQTEMTLPKWMNALKINSYKGFTDKKLYNINDIPITEDYTTINNYIIDVKDLNPFSMTKITKDKICSEKYLKTSKNSMENSHLKLEVNSRKVTITDKTRNEIYKDFIIITDRADIGDSYNFGPLKDDKPIRAVLNSYKLKESNSVRAVMSLVFDISIPAKSGEKGRSTKEYKHKIKFDAVLYNQAKYIEFKAEWENKSTDHILQAGFNLKKK